MSIKEFEKLEENVFQHQLRLTNNNDTMVALLRGLEGIIREVNKSSIGGENQIGRYISLIVLGYTTQYNENMYNDIISYLNDYGNYISKLK